VSLGSSRDDGTRQQGFSNPIQGALLEPSRLKSEYAVEVFSGIRPSGNLTVANYVGAVSQFINLQERGLHPLVFVADLHLLTDKEPADALKFNREIVLDYLGCGMDPRKCNIFLQSDLKEEVFSMTALMMRHISIAELLRLPTLKDKMKGVDEPEQVNALLGVYPVMMAADILLQRPRFVPVGEDQLPHIEVTRKIARRFNAQYGDVLPLPEAQETPPVRILGLKGTGKMGKSHPEEAIFLSDSADIVAKKIKGAKTGNTSEMTDALRSNITLAKGLTRDPEVLSSIDSIVERHLAGEPAMGKFKQILTDVAVTFVRTFQERRAEFASQPELINEILDRGANSAKENARETLRKTYKAMGM
jgi:tryptophanyl-tRNA synthetase